MKRIIATALLIISSIYCNRANAGAIGTWNAYMAYHDVQQVAAAGDDVFVMASNNLYSYNRKDLSITIYDKTRGLSDVYITNIAWSKTARRLIAVYYNSNIDLIDTSGNVTNISNLYTKSMTGDKTVNSITIDGKYAYLATGFGVVKVDMARAEISESYILDLNIKKVALYGDYIYALRTDNSVMEAPMNTNLIDKKNWTVKSNDNPELFATDNSDYENNISTISNLNPEGPKLNTFGFLRFVNGKLYSTDGLTNVETKGCVQVYDGKDWTLYENDIEDKIGHAFVNLICCDVDPIDEKHVFAGGRTGLYEYYDGKFVKEYTNDNSPLMTAATVSGNDKTYVVVTSVKFDKTGDLWLFNSISPSVSLLKLDTKGEWTSYNTDKLMIKEGRSFELVGDIMFDSQGMMWFNNNYFREPALIRYNTAGTPETDMQVYKNFANQDGITLNVGFVTGITEDKEYNMWMGTNVGPMMIPTNEIGTGSDDLMTLTQVKVPRNDGTNYADYLLNNVSVSTVAIDGSNRKWFGTNGNGVYLISADNMTEIHHFTSENSSLLDDNILSIAINDRTGEVFFATEKGLCSYMSDATEPTTEMTKDNVYAYPNPVRPEYTGLITVVGLTYDADVKIVTSNGAIVNQGRSNGGSYTWNGKDMNGNRVASGIYMVQTATSEGKKGTVCKIAIIN